MGHETFLAVMLKPDFRDKFPRAWRVALWHLPWPQKLGEALPVLETKNSRADFFSRIKEIKVIKLSFLSSCHCCNDGLNVITHYFV